MTMRKRSLITTIRNTKFENILNDTLATIAGEEINQFIYWIKLKNK